MGEAGVTTRAAGGAKPARPATFSAPWRDRAGRVSPLKVAALAGVLAPGAVLAWWLATGDLGAEPVVTLTHETGLWAIRLLLITLAVTPLRYVADWPKVVILRRMLGLAALAYAVAHLGIYVVDQHFRLLHVAAEILRRTYLTIGFVALLGLSVLGVTSTDGWIRRLRARWKTLHRAIFAVVALGVLHFFMQSKVDVSQAVLMAGGALWAVLWRLLPGGWRARPRALLGLAVATMLGTAAIEYGWYAAATRVPPMRVLLANLDVSFGLRPALWVGVVALGTAAVPVVRGLLRRAPAKPALIVPAGTTARETSG